MFAPTNEAFDGLPKGTVETLVKPENKAMLTKILTYHVVPGEYSTTKLRSMIMAGHGTATLTTVAGGKLWLMMNGSSNITVKDEKGDISDITIADVYHVEWRDPGGGPRAASRLMHRGGGVFPGAPPLPYSDAANFPPTRPARSADRSASTAAGLQAYQQPGPLG